MLQKRILKFLNISCLAFSLCFAMNATAVLPKAEPTPIMLTPVEAKQSLKIYTEHFPPYNFDSEGQLTGINLEIVRTMCELADIACDFELYPWKRAFRMAEETSGSGLVSTARTHKREAQFKWVGPLASGQHCIYKLSSRTDIVIEDASSLAQHTVAATNDNSHTAMLEALGLSSGENLLWFAMKYDELKPFTAGRVDLIVGSALTIEAQVKHAELTLSDIAPVFVIELPPHLGNYLALNIDTDDELVDKLKASLDMLRSQNMIKSIEKQFVKPFPMKQASAKDQNLWNTCVKSFD